MNKATAKSQKGLSNHKIVTLAVYLLGGDAQYVDTEDAAVKANELAPARLLELCRQLPWCRVADDRVTAAQLLNPNGILSDSEQRIFRS